MYEQGAAVGGLGSQARGSELQKAALNQATVAHGDTFAGQISMMDELISSSQGLLERLTRHCNALVPMHEGTGDVMTGAIRGGLSPVKDDPNSGPLLFRMQNRNRALFELQSQIAQQLNRLEMAL